MEPSAYRSLSFWHDTVPDPLEPRAPLSSDEQVDVAIVGAGYTGLWTAYYLKALQPDIRVAIVEAEIAGFGASGRNGGWCLGALAGMDAHFEDPARHDGAVRLQRAMFDTVDEVARVSEKEAIDCHYAKGGNVSVAMVEAHRQILRSDLDAWREHGFGEEDLRWLEPEECLTRVRTSRNLGGLFFPHCAAIHPARLARGLADAVERRGVVLYERSPALAIEPGRVVTQGGRLRADLVVRATEGYTRRIPGHRRALLPLHSMMIATEPLPDEVWQQIGLANRETFADPRRTVTYAQRTADGRLAAGSRGNYFFGSGIRDRFASDDSTFDDVRQVYESMLPVLRDYEITHRWGGPLGVPRDWLPRVGIDRKAGLGWAGGYVGEGVAASNLAARTLADLILQRNSDRVALPWVASRFPKWEPEPLRWIASSALTRLARSLDESEFSGREAPRLRQAVFKSFVRK